MSRPREAAASARRGPAARELKELMLRAPALTLATAESMTCGRVQAAIGAVSGASNFFLGGITAYTLDEKVRHLGVDRRAAKKVNCVSADVAAQMARGACALFGSDIGVATTGYAEPAPAEGVADPLAWWAIAVRARGPKKSAERVLSGRIECPGAGRIDAQQIVADAVLSELLAVLRDLRAGRG